MKWFIEYINGKLVNEDQISFSQIKKKNALKIYFLGKKNAYGIDLINKLFFVNKKIYDFKIKGDIIDFFQYKKSTLILNVNKNQIQSYNCGIKVEDDCFFYIYNMEIKKNTISLICEKKNKSTNELEKRKILL